MTPNQIAILVLSVCIVFGFGGVLVTWMIWPPLPQHSDLLSAMIGAAATAYIQVINYWFQKPKDPTA